VAFEPEVTKAVAKLLALFVFVASRVSRVEIGLLMIILMIFFEPSGLAEPAGNGRLGDIEEGSLSSVSSMPVNLRPGPERSGALPYGTVLGIDIPPCSEGR